MSPDISGPTQQSECATSFSRCPSGGWIKSNLSSDEKRILSEEHKIGNSAGSSVNSNHGDDQETGYQREILLSVAVEVSYRWSEDPKISLKFLQPAGLILKKSGYNEPPEVFPECLFSSAQSFLSSTSLKYLVFTGVRSQPLPALAQADGENVIATLVSVHSGHHARFQVVFQRLRFLAPAAYADRTTQIQPVTLRSVALP